ncbi:hypothetical protein M0R45_031295 [Rubus argutus]|uniref:Uncharacterized protein n=1 Tax=Rubus argutus TaxID=59490 RepID=A0AAW1WDK7_RUBAR
MQYQADASLFIKEDELVGIEAQKKILMGWLMNGEPNQTVIPIVGMGGSGKTTLVASTFNNDTVKRHFNCYAWITVSQTYEIEDLYRNLINKFHQSRKEEIPPSINALSSTELIQMLVSYLKSKSYLVVLDDVWDINLWNRLSVPLRDEQLGSRVVLTTRNQDVANHAFGAESCVHHIQLLREKDSWELFSKKAFSTYPNKSCPSELEPVARKILGKCEGLPLAIVALGGVMSSKKSYAEWINVCNSLNWHLANNPLLGSVKNILLLSFNDLPYQLKHCFLYCSLFPEDYEMKRKRLIRLWIAEGFVEHQTGVTPEVVAEHYLSELCFRSMLQVVKSNPAGRPKILKLHDLIREIAVSTSMKEKFCASSHGKELKEVMKENGARRLSIQMTEGEIESYTGMSQLRSFLVFSIGMSSLCLSNSLIAEFKLLRTLDLENVPIEELPDGVVYLFNLRYLNLKGTAIKKLPKSIGRLRNLQTLNICDTKIGTLPKGIAKLLNLRHLIMYHYRHDFTDEILGTNALSSPSPQLRSVCVVGKLEKVPPWFHSLRNLTHLGLHWSRLEEDLLPYIEALPCLGKLALVNSYVGKELCFGRGFVKLT